MKILTPGHKYELADFEPTTQSGGQTLQLIEKRLVEGGTAGQLETVNNGTTNEEVIAVLVDRLNSLGAKFPSRENSLAVTKLEEALMWLNQRTKNRTARGVEGKALA